MYPERPRSNFWFLLPILLGLFFGFLGLIGGIIAYFVLRHDDPKKAKNCLYLGIGFTIIGLLLSIWLLTQIPGIDQSFNINV